MPERLRRALRALHRRVLIHRRPLAAVLLATAVFLSLQTLRPAPAPRTDVVVAARDLPAGHRLAAADLRTVARTTAWLPEGLPDEPTGAVLATPLRRGEIVTDVRLLGPGLTFGGNRVAVPVRVPDAGAVAVLDPGMSIDLVGVPAGEGSASRVVVRDAQVLALPGDDTAGLAPGGGSGPGSGRLVLLGVPPESAVEVAQASAREWLTVVLSG